MNKEEWSRIGVATLLILFIGIGLLGGNIFFSDLNLSPDRGSTILEESIQDPIDVDDKFYTGGSIDLIQGQEILGQNGWIVILDEPSLSEYGLDKDSITTEDFNEQRIKIENQHVLFEEAISQIGTLKTVGSTVSVLNSIFVEGNDQNQIEEIENLPGVKSVHPNLIVNSDLFESAPLVEADTVWEKNQQGGKCESAENTVTDDVEAVLSDGTERRNDCITGEGVTIGIIDTGVDYTHQDLGNCESNGNFEDGLCEKVILGYDFVTCQQYSSGDGSCILPQEEDTDPMDEHGHGTHVAATAAGNGALKGVAPDANIVAYRALNKQAVGEVSWVINAIESSVDPNKDGDFSDRLDVISLSLGIKCAFYSTICGPDDPLSTAIDNAVNLGVVAVISAGNNGLLEDSNIGSPGTSRKAITVGATRKNTLSSTGIALFEPDQLAPFTSHGPIEYGNEVIDKPDLVAPGVSICAAQWQDAWSYSECLESSEHTAISGTSMAAPHVSGAVALLLQKEPHLTPDEIKYRLTSTVEIINEVNSETGIDYNFEHAVGSGRINVNNALFGEPKPRVILSNSDAFEVLNGLEVNGNGIAEPGEETQLVIQLRSIGQPINSISSSLSSTNSEIVIEDPLYDANLNIESNENFDIEFAIILPSDEGFPNKQDFTVDLVLNENEVSQLSFSHIFKADSSYQYQTCSPNDLFGVRYDLDGDYMQVCDIDLEYNEFPAIGHYNIYSDQLDMFTGTFNGNGHVIQNLLSGQALCNNNCGERGLFGLLSGEVINTTIIGFKSEDETSLSYVGALVGNLLLNGKVDNSYVENVEINHGHYVGGLVGGSSSIIFMPSTGLVSNSGAKNVFINGASDSAGGLMGRNFQSNIVNSFAYDGEITCDSKCGGLIGTNDNGDAGDIVENSFSSVSIIDSGNSYGRIGGLIGLNKGALENSYTVGEIQCETVQCGAVIGENTNSNLEAIYWSSDINPELDSCGSGDCDGLIEATTTSMLEQSTYTNWDFQSIWNILEGISYPYLHEDYILTFDQDHLFDCGDGVDNDGDGFVDLGDQGCEFLGDLSEYGENECDDGVDNDGDGFVDLGDQGCEFLGDLSEYGENECDDGVDNDGDGFVDLDDQGCDDTSDESEPYCGDGYVDPEEQCDDGNEEDGDGCSQCLLDSACSDGFDNDGDGFVDLDDQGCTDSSDEDEAHCGDGVCSASEGQNSCLQDCGTGTVFLTSSLNPTVLFNTREYANSICQQAADDANLEGHYVAWISFENLDAKDAIADRTYERVDGVVVSENKADLLDGTINAEINIDESGMLVQGGSPYVATGTKSNGELSANCNDWTDDTADYTAGIFIFTLDDGWTDITALSCGSQSLSRLYCFES